ncbi:DoxX-like family protein [Amycolatopsis marina]|uniref:DoxX-like family protein n=1 Tax=Amycolatopsis marina TaxID=490629 RepID=A0A1I1BLP7_9PSEU|nr:DoxX family protein [Amycolatopsis marina]SFB51319.1 DoxX-like family protein [Amycolatopsis marina]
MSILAVSGTGGGVVTALAVTTVLCIVANLAISVADFRRAEFVLANSAEVGLPPSTIPYLATLKTAGAAGLAVGFVGLPWLGLAAGIGLVVFFIGAVGAHVRARVLHNIGFPSLYLLLALCATAYFAQAVR